MVRGETGPRWHVQMPPETIKYIKERKRNNTLNRIRGEHHDLLSALRPGFAVMPMPIARDKAMNNEYAQPIKKPDGIARTR